MANLDRENMTEEIRERFDKLTLYEQWAIEAIMEAGDYTLEEALDVVERGDYAFHPGVYSLVDLAYKLVRDGVFGDLETMGHLVRYIDYKGLAEDLRRDCYMETSLGAIRVSYL